MDKKELKALAKQLNHDSLTLTHDEAVEEIRKRAAGITIEEAANAFLYSLSSGDLRYRTILSSVVWGRSLKSHNVVGSITYSNNGYYGECCDVCGMHMNLHSGKCNADMNSYGRLLYCGGLWDICEAGYVLLDLREYEKLPKVSYCEEDVKILNRIFGLVEELGSGNKAIALHKLIMAEKFFGATGKEVHTTLGVLSICGMFDTPEHKSVATHFVPNHERLFEIESDMYYPLNMWRGKYGVNYDAVEKIFGNIAAGKVGREHTLRGEVKRDLEQSGKKKKKSKAESYFTEGEHFIDLSNEERYYYGLAPLDPAWEKETRYSVTHTLYKRSEIYFDGDIVHKIIYEEIRDKRVLTYCYKELDMCVKTDSRKLILPLTKRGRPQPLTPTLLMTPTYMHEQLYVMLTEDDDKYCVSSFNSSNDQLLPLPKGRISSREDFAEYTKKYIASLPDYYDDVIDNFRNKKRVTVKFHAGAVFRVHLTPNTYTYGLILGKVREIEKWDEVSKEHPMHRSMTQPIIYRQYDIVTENGNMTIEELSKVPLRPAYVAQDNEILWETYPIIGYKKLEETDIDLGFEIRGNKIVFGLGFYEFDDKFIEDIKAEYDGLVRCYDTSVYIYINDKVSEHEMKRQRVRRFVEDKLHISHENSMDEFAAKYGGMTRKQFIRRMEQE